MFKLFSFLVVESYLYHVSEQAFIHPISIFQLVHLLLNYLMILCKILIRQKVQYRGISYPPKNPEVEKKKKQIKKPST